MSPTRDKLVTGALLISESAWLVALLGVLSFPFGATASPISWVAVLAVMAISLITARALAMIIMPSLMAYGLQMIAGVIVVFLMVASQVSPDTNILNLGWIGAMTSDGVSDRFILKAIYGSFGGAALWWRGGHIGAADMPSESLSTSFRIGIIILAIAAVIDIANPADLNVFPMMFVFFASGVSGLIIAHMAPTSQQTDGNRTWTRLIGGMVGALVILGLLFSLLQRNVLAIIAAPFLWMLELIAKAVFYVFIYPLAYVVDFLTRMLFALLVWLGGEPQAERTFAPPQGVGNFESFTRDGEAEPVALLLLQILQWSVVTAIIVGTLLLMALAFRRRVRRRNEEVDGMRESLIEDADLTYDFASLLFNMLPSRFRRRRAPPGLRLPSDDPNITDVFRVYFGLLTLAEQRGHPRHSSETPSEFQRTLENLFPPSLVRAATTAFTRACYGHHPATREQIEEMRIELEEVAKTKGS